MTNFFIIHGSEGSPDENWFPWLKVELEKLGHRVFVPQFPTPENQTLDNWLKVLAKYQEFITSETIFVGHSLGVPFILNILEKYSVKAAFFVAGFTGKMGNRFDEPAKTFAQKKFDWQKIKENCQNFVIFHSDNDPYVKLEKAQEIAKNLEIEVQLVEGAGHFNNAAGYDKFELLLEEIETILMAAN